ncbi:MAG: GH3 auxin-responsive promoter family protein [Lachnospiraceae bacterium]|nr:GH3 auxin-responsive promoter family protein [Lachnospiraceae bacterium]
MSNEVIDKYIDGGLAALERMERASLHAESVSLETLLRVIRENEDTEYGRKYDFKNIHSYSEFASKVPFSEYSDYEPYIERMVCFGTKKLITAADIAYFAHTSGTTGSSKMIPRTREELDILFSDIFMRAFGLCERDRETSRVSMAAGDRETFRVPMEAGDRETSRVSMAAGDRETFRVSLAAGAASPARTAGGMTRCKGVSFIETQTGFTPFGIPHGAISETLNRLEDTKLCSALPEEIIYSASDFDRRHIKLLFALRERNLSYLIATFSPMIYDMIAYLQKHWKELCEDLAAGRIRQDVWVEQSLRAKLNALLSPDIERAEQIRHIMTEFGNSDFLPRIWPDLRLVACVGTASFAPYMDKIKTHLGPEIVVDYLGYVASEATVAAQIREGEEAYMLLPYSGFYEFIPVEGDSEGDLPTTSGVVPPAGDGDLPTSGVAQPRGVQPLLMDQLEVGREYELIVTNLSGFYRYRIGDVIRVTGFHNNCPMIVFSYRKKQLINMYGEKITESVMQKAIAQLAAETSTTILEYSIYPDTDSDPGHYIVLLESNEEIIPERWSYYSEILDKILCDVHDSYRMKIEQKMMLSLDVRFVQPQTYALYRDLMIMDGVSPNQIKPIHVIRDEKTKRFFFSLVQGN